MKIDTFGGKPVMRHFQTKDGSGLTRNNFDMKKQANASTPTKELRLERQYDTTMGL